VEQQETKAQEQRLASSIPVVGIDARESGVKVEEAGDAAPKPKKPRAKKVKIEPEADPVLQGSEGLAKEPQPQIKAKKSRAKKRPIEEVEADSEAEEEPEYVRRKSRSRAIPLKDVVDVAK
jgi:hypothetical protein